MCCNVAVVGVVDAVALVVDVVDAVAEEEDKTDALQFGDSFNRSALERFGSKEDPGEQKYET